MSLCDLFVAGMDTQSRQLEWIMYYMAKYPEIQRKVQDEVDVFVGPSLELSLAHRSALAYTEAVVQEALRKASIVPLGLMHMTGQDYELDGYAMPKGTVVMANLFASHHSPEVWGDPEVFRPERFIASGANSGKSMNSFLLLLGNGAALEKYWLAISFSCTR